MLRIMLLGGLVLAGGALLLFGDWEEGPSSAGPREAATEFEGGPTLSSGLGKKPGAEGDAKAREAARHLFEDLRQMSAKDQANLLQTRRNATPDASIPFSEDLARLLLQLLASADPNQAAIAQDSLRRMGTLAAGILNEALAGDHPRGVKQRILWIEYYWRLTGQAFPLPDLLPLLADAESPLCLGAMQLIRRGVPYEPRVATRLVEMMREPGAQGPLGAGMGLAGMGAEGISLLAGLAKGEGFQLKLAALGALRYAQSEHLRPHLSLLSAMIANPAEEPRLRAAAISALSAMHGDCGSCLPALRVALADESHEYITPCLAVLSAMGQEAAPAVPDLLRWLKETDERVSGATAAALGKIGARPDLVLPALSEMILTKGSDEGARALGTFGSAAFPEAQRILGEGDEYAQYSIMWAFATMGEAAAPVVPQLIALIDGEDEDLSLRAVGTLGYIGPKADAAVPAIMKRLLEGTLSAQAAAGTLVRLGDTVEAPLLAALRSGNPTARHNAVRALGHFQQRSAFALDDLEPLAAATDVALRRDALNAISAAILDDNGDVPAQPAPDPATLTRIRRLFEAGLKDKDDQIRQQAEWMVQVIDAALAAPGGR